MVDLTIKTYLTFIFRHVFQGDNRTQSWDPKHKIARYKGTVRLCEKAKSRSNTCAQEICCLPLDIISLKAVNLLPFYM